MSVWILIDGTEENLKAEKLMLKMERGRDTYEIFKKSNHYRLLKNNKLMLISIDYDWIRSHIFERLNYEV